MTGLRAISDFYEKKKLILEKTISDSVFVPYFGLELEFYLLNSSFQPCKDGDSQLSYISDLKNILKNNLAVYEIEKEHGTSQIEIKIAPSPDLARLCQNVEEIKFLIKNLAKKNNLIASFAAQPFEDDCGSALQFNFSLHDKNGENLFIKKDDLFFSSIAGMLEFIDGMMVFCAPQKEDYRRFNLEINRTLHKKGKYPAPVNVSFGDNNRSAAIRVPHPQKIEQSRIEFRVAAADADAYLVMSSLLIAVNYAIENKIILDEKKKVFGNAFDEQYGLKKFAATLEEAENDFFQEGNVMKDLLQKIL